MFRVIHFSRVSTERTRFELVPDSCTVILCNMAFLSAILATALCAIYIGILCFCLLHLQNFKMACRRDWTPNPTIITWSLCPLGHRYTRCSLFLGILFNLHLLSSPILSYLSRIMIRHMGAEMAKYLTGKFWWLTLLVAANQKGDSLCAKDLQDTLRRPDRGCRKRSLGPSLPSDRSPDGFDPRIPAETGWRFISTNERDT